jgi:hypothetical protein
LQEFVKVAHSKEPLEKEIAELKAKLGGTKQ